MPREMAYSASLIRPVGLEGSGSTTISPHHTIGPSDIEAKMVFRYYVVESEQLLSAESCHRTLDQLSEQMLVYCTHI